MYRLDTFAPLLAGLLDQGCARRVFSGGAAAVFTARDMVTAVAGRRSRDGDAVRPCDWFDLASLTKPLCTALAIADLAGKGALALDDPLAGFFAPGETPAAWRRITVAMLLAHTAGLPAWRPYYQQLTSVACSQRKALLLRLLAAEPLESAPEETVRYSDLGFLLLGLLVERLSGATLDRYVTERMYRPLGVELFFNRTEPAPAIRPGRYVATSNCERGQQLLWGEVHDDNAWALGGVAGHAGLFGSVGAVAALLQGLLRAWLHGAPLAGIPAALVARFCNHAGPRALGFDRPDPAASISSAGARLSRQSIGHLGFTGTSFWLDPEQGLGIVLLTNRVHLAADKTLIRRYRAWFHDTVMEAWQGREAKNVLTGDEAGRSFAAFDCG